MFSYRTQLLDCGLRRTFFGREECGRGGKTLERLLGCHRRVLCEGDVVGVLWASSAGELVGAPNGSALSKRPLAVFNFGICNTTFPEQGFVPHNNRAMSGFCRFSTTFRPDSGSSFPPKKRLHSRPKKDYIFGHLSRKSAFRYPSPGGVPKGGYLTQLVPKGGYLTQFEKGSYGWVSDTVVPRVGI